MDSADWQEIAEGLGRTLAYLGVGAALLVVGFLVLDVLTPGRLSHHIMDERSPGAARVAAAGMLGLAIVVGTSILTTHDDFTYGLVTTAVFGAVGVLLQGAVFKLLDALTPGNLGDVVCDEADHPGTWLVAASLLAASLLVAASIS